MVAWRSLMPDWHETDYWNAYDRLEAYGQAVGDDTYTEPSLSVEPALTAGDGQVGTDPATERNAA